MCRPSSRKKSSFELGFGVVVVASTEAFVLRRVEYRDSDLIVTLLTRDFGRISALARGARSSRRRFGGALGLCTLSLIEVRQSPRSELWTLQSAQVRNDFAALGADLTALAHASYGAELLRTLLPIEAAEPEVFDLFHQLLVVLARGGASPAVLRVFELRLLRLLGTAPTFARCVGCGASEGLAKGAIFDPDRGGVVCRRCAPSSLGIGVKPMSNETRALLCRYSEASLEEVVAEVGEPGSDRARDLMLALVQGYAGTSLRSLEFAAKMNSKAARG